jgi:predicted metal-dependent hydrolase
VSSWYAKWTLQHRSPTKGSERLFVNLVLSTREKIVSDDVLRYLIYHEMLHHLLPLHGHDRTFRQLESRWLNAVALDAQLEALQDDWELAAARYRKRKLI